MSHAACSLRRLITSTSPSAFLNFKYAMTTSMQLSHEPLGTTKMFAVAPKS